MSDLASPLLVVMRDEPHAYVCFCALMRRLGPSFDADGEAMTLKFKHLSDLVEHFDSAFFRYVLLLQREYTSSLATRMLVPRSRCVLPVLARSEKTWTRQVAFRAARVVTRCQTANSVRSQLAPTKSTSEDKLLHDPEANAVLKWLQHVKRCSKYVTPNPTSKKKKKGGGGFR